MVDQFIYASPMAIIVIGAFVLMLLSNSKITLTRLNLIAVFFLTVSLVLQFFLYGAKESTYLFENIFGKISFRYSPLIFDKKNYYRIFEAFIKEISKVSIHHLWGTMMS